MKVRVLGASGSSLPKKKLPAFLINDFLLLDAGSITNSLSLQEQEKIRFILITHAHLDHIQDLPYLLDNLFLAKSPHKIRLFAISEVIKQIKKNLFNSLIWPDFSNIPNPEKAILQYEEVELNTPFTINGLKITPLPTKHSVASAGFLIEEGEKSLLYTGDTTYDPNLWRKYGYLKLNALITEISLPSSHEDLAFLTGHLTPNLLLKGLSHFSHPPERIFIYHLKVRYRREIMKELRNLTLPRVELLREDSIIEI